MLHDEEWGEPSNNRHKLQTDGSNSESSSRGSNWRWMIVVGVFIVQLTIPTIFSAYGVILVHLVKNNEIRQLTWRGLLPPAFYIITRSFVDPICYNIFSGQSLKVKTITFSGALMMAGSIATNVVSNAECLQIFTIGILGGLSASVAVTQAEAVLLCHYPSQHGLIQVFYHFAHALGHFGIPLLINGLILKYGILGSVLLYSGIVLHGLIGATILSPPRDNSEMSPNLNRPRTFTVDCVELTEFPSGFNVRSDHSPLLARDRSWKNPATASDSRYDIPQTSSPVISLRRKKINGVDILPEIPEESEEATDDSDSDSSKSDIFRTQNNIISPYSFHEAWFNENENSGNDFKENEEVPFSTSLMKWRNTDLQSEMMDKINKRDLNKNCERVSNAIEYPEDIKTFTSLTDDQVRFQRCSGCCRSFLRRVQYILLCRCCKKLFFYDLYIWIINLPNNIQFYMIEPLINAFKVPYFLPAVLFYSVSRFNPLLFVTFVPYLLKLNTRNASPLEGALAISVAAFCWLIYLMFSPCLLQSRENTKKTIYFVGSFVLSAGLYILSTTRNHSYFVVGSALFGIGHGATVGTFMYVLEEELGIRDLVKVQGPLSVVSGCFILLTSVLLGVILQEDTGISKSFVTLSVLQLATNILLILSFFKSRLIHIRSIATHEWHPGGEF